MIVYEFWLKEQFKEQPFEVLCDNFYKIGTMEGRWDNPTGEGTCVYAVSRNPITHWVQLLVDDNTPAPFITAIEARINGMKDDYPVRKYTSEENSIAPMEVAKE